MSLGTSSNLTLDRNVQVNEKCRTELGRWILRMAALEQTLAFPKINRIKKCIKIITVFI